MTATFILIHGAWHGGWCWERIAPLLEARGHTVLAPDLPGMGADRAPLAEDVLGQWTDFVATLVEAQAEPIVLVGHSRGGLLVSTVAERVPDRVALAVYLSAPMLRDGEAVTDADFLTGAIRAAFSSSADGDAVAIDPERATELFYDDVAPEIAARAIARLVDEPVQPADAKLRLRAERFGRVPRAYIETTLDRAVSPEAQRAMQRRWPCRAVVGLPCGHSSFYAMPERLADVLDDLATARPNERDADRSLGDLFRPEAVSQGTRAVNARFAAALAAQPAPPDLDATREAVARGLLGLPASPKSSRASVETIPGPGGDIALRVLRPDAAKGAYLHLHGGGWMLGTNDLWDGQLEVIGREAGLIAVSVDYRLAPEHPFPAAVDDCVAAATWLIERGGTEFGVSWLAIGGESAGAHLAAATLLRLREAGHGHAFRAANLMFGCFDLSLTPSARRAEGTLFADRAKLEAFAAAYCGGADPRDPRVSPLYADLRGLPPALFSVGTLDPLVDDSLFMHMRWQAAGNVSELAVYPGGIHGFNALDGALAEEANRSVGRFLDAAQRDVFWRGPYQS